MRTSTWLPPRQEDDEAEVPNYSHHFKHFHGKGLPGVTDDDRRSDAARIKAEREEAPPS